MTEHTDEYQPGDKWAEWKHLTCVECPVCAFTFSDEHQDADGGWSCPVCAQVRLEAENERLRDQWLGLHGRIERALELLESGKQYDAEATLEAALFGRTEGSDV